MEGTPSGGRVFFPRRPRVRALPSERVSVRTERLCSDIEPLWPIATKRDKSDEEPTILRVVFG